MIFGHFVQGTKSSSILSHIAGKEELYAIRIGATWPSKLSQVFIKMENKRNYEEGGWKEMEKEMYRLAFYLITWLKLSSLISKGNSSPLSLFHS